MIINSMKEPNLISRDPFSIPGFSASNPLVLSGYTYAWLDVKKYILNTVIVAFAEVFGVLLFASLAAYGFTRFKFKGKDTLFTVFLAFMMIPSILTLATQFSLVSVKLNLGESFWGIILPAVAGGMPVNIFLIRTFFAGVPDSLFEAAELDGASHLRRYLSLALPLCMPILFTIGLSTLLGAWNDTIWAGLILGAEEELYTISVGVFKNYTGANATIKEHRIYAAYCIASLPLVIAFAFTSKQFIKGLTNGAIKM